jgi:ketosteroid isomerase-like protein
LYSAEIARESRFVLLLKPNHMTSFRYIGLFILSLAACNSNPSTPKPTEFAMTNNQSIIDQYFAHFNAHDWQKMADMYIDTPEMKDPAYGTQNVRMTKEDIIKKYAELEAMIPDVKDRVVQMYHSGNFTIVEFESSGTAPDGSPFVLPICTVFEVIDGKITKDLTYYDNF